MFENSKGRLRLDMVLLTFSHILFVGRRRNNLLQSEGQELWQTNERRGGYASDESVADYDDEDEYSDPEEEY
jgi:hypothetical protein